MKKTQVIKPMKKTVRFQPDRETLERYRSLLPHGAQKEIHRRTGIREASITDFLGGRLQGWHIEEAILDYIADFHGKRNAKLDKAGLLQ